MSSTKQEVDILLVDDDKDICVMVEAILQFAGHQVKSCSIPDQLPQLLQHTKPRLLLMDMLLSGTDGRDVCRQLKAEPENDHIKIIMMSAHPDADRSCREAGADDFISKPFDMDYFIGRVNTQLSGR
jgi:DNA-binding response OmpR family regulator